MVSIPFMVFPILASLKNISPNVEMASASLGATPMRIFWTVTFSLSLPGVAAGVVIVYLFELTSYIVPGLLGGGYADMIANFITTRRCGLSTIPSRLRGSDYARTFGIVVLSLNKLFDRLTRHERA